MSNRQSRRARERATRRSFRDCSTVARVVKTMVNPIEDGTGSSITATLQSLMPWRDFHAKLLQRSTRILFTHEGVAAGHQWVNCAPSSCYDLIVSLKMIKNKENLKMGF